MSETLLDDAALEASSVVAHRFMNRERELRGGNGYARELGLDVLELLRARAIERGHAAWLDLCCGSGRAVIEAATRLHEERLSVSIRGVDLVRAFAREPSLPNLVLEEASLHRYEAAERYDLVTCVHGLHYVGDKLDLIARACRWLTDDGVFVATLDLGTLRVGGAIAKRRVARVLREQGLEVDLRRHRVRCDGMRVLKLPWTYLGADDRAGPSFTGEPAVASHYAKALTSR